MMYVSALMMVGSLIDWILTSNHHQNRPFEHGRRGLGCIVRPVK
jgi:hypothetical protein